jgi:hypothetical protein
MRRLFMGLTWATIIVGASSLIAGPAAAQRDTAPSFRNVPREVARDVEARWSATSAVIRSDRPEEIAAGREVRGDVVIRDARLTIRGHITGNVLVVNGDVTLHPGAAVDGDLWVVGGDVQGRNDASIGGELRIYREPLRYRAEGEGGGTRITITSDDSGRDRRGGPPRRDWRDWGRDETSFDLGVFSAGAYNRVEGLPVKIGPSIRDQSPWGRFRLDAHAIVRTGSTFNSDRGDVGHDVKIEVQAGQRRTGYFGVGGRLFNVVDPIESWQMSDLETSLAAFVDHRDYRDYFERRGASAFVSAINTDELRMTAGFSEERWGGRDVRDPYTLFRNDVAWRPNSVVDAGRMHLATASMNFDTRNTPDAPWAGWYVRADFEQGVGTLQTVAPMTTLVRRTQPGDRIRYSRGFLDARRYNRLSPTAQLNMRVVVGGWLNGDELPLERRLSVDAPGPLPGFDFRVPRAGRADVATCTSGTALILATECERIAVAQIEYRGSLHFGIDIDDWNDVRNHVSVIGDGPTWVLFADAGRGWLVGDAATSTLSPLVFTRDRIPPLSSFRSDIGVGVDLGGFGVYVAKSVSDGSEPLNIFLRLKRRF